MRDWDALSQSWSGIDGLFLHYRDAIRFYSLSLFLLLNQSLVPSHLLLSALFLKHISFPNVQGSYGLKTLTISPQMLPDYPTFSVFISDF